MCYCLSGDRTVDDFKPELIGKLEVVTPAAIQKMLERYEAQIIRAPVEHAIIITSAGDVLHCNGDEAARCRRFSDDDFKLFKNFGLARLRGIDEKFIYELNRNPSENELAEYTLVEGFGYWRRGR